MSDIPEISDEQFGGALFRPASGHGFQRLRCSKLLLAIREPFERNLNRRHKLHPAPIDAVERVMGIEPTSSAWEAEVLPLNYTRNEPFARWDGRQDSMRFPRTAQSAEGRPRRQRRTPAEPPVSPSKRSADRR